MIDLQACQAANRYTGIARYSMSLAKKIISQADGKHDVRLVLNGLFPETLETIKLAFCDLLEKNKILVYSLPVNLSEQHPENAWRARSAELIRESYIAELKPDIVHVASLFEGWEDDSVVSIGASDSNMITAVTLYDLNSLVRSDRYLKNLNFKGYCQRKFDAIKKSGLLLTLSDFSSNEAIDMLGFDRNSVVNISLGVDDQFQLLDLSLDREVEVLKKYNIHRSFIMCAQEGFESRKNISRMIEAYVRLPASIREKNKLVVVSKILNHERDSLMQLANELGLINQEFVIIGSVPVVDLVSLYNLCSLFVSPSLYEEFGLPVLEAMACGAPTIGSGCTGIAELIGYSDALFDPLSIDSIAKKILQSITDDSFRQRLSENAAQQTKKFSLDESARRALAAFESKYEQEVVQLKTNVSLLTKKYRLAFVSPLPPEKTGIADYSVELLPELSRFYDVTVITDQVEIESSVCDKYKINNVSWFHDNGHEFDRIVYQFGNSIFHKHMFSLLRLYPGVVVLHDFYLSGVKHWLAGSGIIAGAFYKTLYESHGYPAVKTALTNGEDAAEYFYPCNIDVLENAAGVIVHSRYSYVAAYDWYGEAAASDFFYIPQLHVLEEKPDREFARKYFGFTKDDFVVCSFGLLNPNKLNHVLLDTWLDSLLLHDKRCHLIFVGENHPGDYGKILLGDIQNSIDSDRIHITGFVSAKEYKHYLNASDVAVQLRTQSRGETSRAVLDVLAHAVPLIINANGTMDEYPEEILIKLADNFSNDELSASLVKLYNDSSLRKSYGNAGYNYVSDNHSPVKVGNLYREAIESFSVENRNLGYQKLLSGIRNLKAPELPENVDLYNAAVSISENQKTFGLKRLFVDISVLVETDLRTGIERVTRSILSELLKLPPDGYRVEPVYWNNTNFRYAQSFTCDLLNIDGNVFADKIIDVNVGDILLSLEWSPATVKESKKTLEKFKNVGVNVYFTVFDILPLQHPEWFPGVSNVYGEWLESIIEVSTGLVCISNSVADDVFKWISSYNPDRLSDIKIGSFHLGADISGSMPTLGLPENYMSVLQMFKNKMTFLMVGTVEPRKGHDQSLKAFEQLWKEGLDINLVIVGKSGWMMEEFTEKVLAHAELNKSLFWLQGISDEYLELIYSSADCLVVASKGEGFGLPLIEAAQKKIPIIARELPVFREVAGQHAFYFIGERPEDLSSALHEWIILYESKLHPTSDSMPWLMWKQSQDQLMKCIIKKEWTLF